MYPIDSLPSIIKDAILAYQQYGQQPTPLIACSALANISLSCQSLANVARDHLLVSPISLFFLVIAQSGERKSAVDKAFGLGIRNWQQNTIEQFIPDNISDNIIYNAWNIERDGIVKQIRRATSNGEDTLQLQTQLKELVKNEPKIQLLPELFFEDVTQEAFVSSLAHGWPSSSLWSDEASIVLSGHGMQNGSTKFIATLNRLWDGNPFLVHRKTSKNFAVSNRRLTVSLMLQPLLMLHLLQRHDGMSRQSGFLARILITHPTSAMGERLYKEPPQKLEALDKFHAQITSCLDQSLRLDSKGCHKLPILSFSPKAKETWVKFFNEVEQGLNHHRKWLNIQDFASKSSENIARLSALLHLFTGKDSSLIDAELVERAISIIHWHLLEAKQILEPSTQSPDTQNAIKLLNWIKTHDLQETSPRYLQQYSPLREKSKRDKAISLLIDHHFVKEIVVDNKTILLINPNCFV
ncbi:MAG: DUF3987 domain-containing protein [Burkholderiales bacterium]|nr:DUF3987 domain-containing protein [Burkholderiales bacterium]